MDIPEGANQLEDVIISPEATIAEAITRLDRAGTGALVLCTGNRKLFGLLTDGDVRRAIMRSASLDEPCGTIANQSPVVLFEPFMPSEALHLMNRYDIDHLPVLNAEWELKCFLKRKDLLGEDGFEAGVRERLESVIIPPETTVSDAIALLDKAGTGALVLCSDGRRLEGLLTDGDIRRAILRGTLMESPCADIACRNPVTAPSSISSRDSLRIMNLHDINQLPLVDEGGAVVELRLRRDLVAEDLADLPAVVMAGGYGKRLLPLTERVPKPMLPVGDRPLLELTIEQLRRCGIREVNLTTHYLPESIMDHFGDGGQFGVKLNYVKEDNPLGTAGGLRLMNKPDRPFLVINGDILTGVSFQEMLRYHRKHCADITVGVRKYEVHVPFGVVQCDDVKVTQLQEKPSLTFFINAGLYLLEPSVYEFIPEGQHFDMTDLIQKLLDAGRMVVSFPIVEYWLDIGKHADYEKAQEDVRNGKL